MAGQYVKTNRIYGRAMNMVNASNNSTAHLSMLPTIRPVHSGLPLCLSSVLHEESPYIALS
jgi:hypothetical protein